MVAEAAKADGLLDAALPSSNGFAAMLFGYFDESQRKKGIFAVAGLAYSKSQAKLCRQDWARLFRPYGGCHMNDLALRQGAFLGIKREEAERLIRGAVEIINERASFGVAVSCDLAEIEALLPKWIQGFEGAYPVCCHLAMHSLGRLVANHDKRRIAYFFEGGHKHEARAHEFMSRVFDTPELRDSYRHFSHTFADKREVTQLQTADVLVWEWAKFIDESVLHRVRPMRGSLKSLVTQGTLHPSGYDTKRFHFNHITGEPLQRFVKNVASLGLSQLAEEWVGPSRLLNFAAPN